MLINFKIKCLILFKKKNYKHYIKNSSSYEKVSLLFRFLCVKTRKLTRLFKFLAIFIKLAGFKKILSLTLLYSFKMTLNKSF